ncbi:hypothetical protein T492DRAFT_928297 [Pavlovales sp. CCMP2436]|nr:hypothetical protein T492DRAFT_928297 [Pavlovales sp. CCMP2436]
MAQPVSLSELEASDETDIGAKLLAARNARMGAENRLTLLRNKIGSILAAQQQAVRETELNCTEKETLWRARSGLSQQRSQLGELREASSRSSPSNRELIVAARTEQREAIKQVRAKEMGVRRANASAVHADHSAVQRALAELEGDRAVLTQRARERVLADRERGADKRLSAIETKRKNACNDVNQLRDQWASDEAETSEVMRREYQILALEESRLIVALHRTQEAALEEAAKLESLSSARVPRYNSTPRLRLGPVAVSPVSRFRRRELFAASNTVWQPQLKWTSR